MIQIELPEDINEYILNIQVQKKLEKGGQFNKQQTILFLLKDHKRLAAIVEKYEKQASEEDISPSHS